MEAEWFLQLSEITIIQRSMYGNAYTYTIKHDIVYIKVYICMCMGILNLAVAEEVGKSSGANLLLWSTR